MRFRAFDTTRPSIPAKHLLFALVVALLLLQSVDLAGAEPAAPPSPAARRTVFVPVANNAMRADDPAPQPGNLAAFFVSTEGKTNTAGSAVDRNGGMHMAFTVFASVGQHPPAVYAYCPGPAASCASSDGWKAVGLSDLVEEVQLQLTPEGKPRLLIRKQRDGHTQDEYVYGECDSNCTEAASWQLTSLVYIGGSEVFAYDNPQHSFALDPQGRPRFVFTNGWGAGWQVGVYYAYCDEDCTNSDNWYATSIEDGPQYRSLEFDYPSLKFTSDGRPRIVSNMSFTGESQGVRYLECDQECGERSSWSGVALYQRGGGVAASWDLELDQFDRPRFAFYQAATDDGAGERLYYVWCDDSCLDASSWQRTTVGLPIGVGQNADMALDGQGRPRIAYRPLLGDGLGYGWCDGDCTTPASWQHKQVETAAKLQAEFPVPNPLTCDPSAWTDAIPSLSLDGQGNPRIAYDNLSISKCYYTKPGDPNVYTRIEKLFRAVRWLQFPQP